ncbi:MAG: KH domain-containing protein [Kiritimatiellia bacterium]|nr:KH domain-containing protein [Kiritimatiellia bacterium]
MRELIENILKALANYPDEVVISELYGRQTIIFEVRCNSDDMGRIIGRSGKTIGSIRTLLGVLAAKQRKKTLLEIVE